MKMNSPIPTQEPRIAEFLAEAESAPPVKTRAELLSDVLAQAKVGIATLHKKGYNAKHIADMINSRLPQPYPKLSAKTVREAIGLRPIPRNEKGSKPPVLL
jgi:hypothetical protein